jgi:hypothetical protein
MVNDNQEEIDVTIEAAEGNNEPDVKVVDAAPEKDAKAEYEDPKDSIEELKRKLNEERQARIDAENRERRAAEMARKASEEVEDTNLHLVNSAIDTVKRDQEFLKTQYRDAMSIGDYDRAAEIQESMGNNSAKLLQLENGKAAMQQKPQPVQPAPRQADPVEQLASQVSPRSASWLRSNRDNIRDERSIRKMFRAHEDAVDEGIEPDTDEYFGFIEGRLGISRHRSQDQDDSPMSAASAPTQRRSAPPAAPVSRSGNGSGGKPNTYRMTAEEREIAQMMGMSPEDYARNKIALRKEGKLSH